MQTFFDNINTKVVDDLKVSIKDGSKLSIASACFSIYAFEEMKAQLKDIDELRFNDGYLIACFDTDVNEAVIT